MTKKKPSLKKTPAARKVDLDKLDNFAAGAGGQEQKPEQEKETKSAVSSKPAPPVETRAKKVEYPWEKPGVREDVKKAVNLLLPEPILLKLRFISKNTLESQQKFLRRIIEPAIEKEIKKLTKHV